MLTVVTAAGVLAEFVVGSLVLVPMSAGPRRRPVERCDSASGPFSARRDGLTDGADPAGATESLWRGGSQNGCPDGSRAASVAFRGLPAPCTSRTGCAP